MENLRQFRRTLTIPSATQRSFVSGHRPHTGYAAKPTILSLRSSCSAVKVAALWMFYHDAALDTTELVSPLFLLSHGLVRSKLEKQNGRQLHWDAFGWIGMAGRHAPVCAISAKVSHPAAKQPNLHHSREYEPS